MYTTIKKQSKKDFKNYYKSITIKNLVCKVKKHGLWVTLNLLYKIHDMYIGIILGILVVKTGRSPTVIPV